ncbi:uncharacterized protein DUF2752 [Roseimicrobium gellanilyticum]|uniref:Uncharacterized protein DUF2752 n=1 Tax=Roseimicrobium gellanilyticum TaxID=748857 RepID=A0A366HMT9_9BACT|nr:DUF2752 domain-containing protein [Roseimicrobium gellanilyticum]RBP43642.1 uncharacterized protein DUF2752 [Roseimicrobium gellanilyticum]
MDTSLQTHGLLRPRVALVLALLCGLTIGAVVLYRNPPGSSWITPPCMMHKITGLHCPGCGSTRATYALLHGDFPGAMKKNIIYVLALPFLGWWAGCSAWRWMCGRPPAPTTPEKVNLQLRLVWAFVAVVALFSVLRNLPWAPFNWLAPH